MSLTNLGIMGRDGTKKFGDCDVRMERTTVSTAKITIFWRCVWMLSRDKMEETSRPQLGSGRTVRYTVGLLIGMDHV
jgi:hypothetical protein